MELQYVVLQKIQKKQKKSNGLMFAYFNANSWYVEADWKRKRKTYLNMLFQIIRFSGSGVNVAILEQLNEVSHIAHNLCRANAL